MNVQKTLALITMYETYLEEIGHMAYEAYTLASKINREMDKLSQVSIDAQAQVLTSLEDMKVSHAKLVTELADYNII